MIRLDILKTWTFEDWFETARFLGIIGLNLACVLLAGRFLVWVVN